ncbi:hypothetical protein [Streptomyces sp. S186]|uniref:hypothetical protein n=1 Tax=Streptomyces sp. S186 TaxID=3434395 RepID=UPI003F67D073
MSAKLGELIDVEAATCCRCLLEFVDGRWECPLCGCYLVVLGDWVSCEQQLVMEIVTDECCRGHSN